MAPRHGDARLLVGEDLREPRRGYSLWSGEVPAHGRADLLSRHPGHRDLRFTIPLRAAAMQAADAGQDVDEIDFPQMI